MRFKNIFRLFRFVVFVCLFFVAVFVLFLKKIRNGFTKVRFCALRVAYRVEKHVYFHCRRASLLLEFVWGMKQKPKYEKHRTKNEN